MTCMNGKANLFQEKQLNQERRVHAMGVVWKPSCCTPSKRILQIPPPCMEKMVCLTMETRQGIQNPLPPIGPANEPNSPQTEW